MIIKIALIIILFAPGWVQYKDVVNVYDTVEACEAAREELVATMPRQQGFHYFATCVQPTPVDSEKS